MKLPTYSIIDSCAGVEMLVRELGLGVEDSSQDVLRVQNFLDDFNRKAIREASSLLESRFTPASEVLHTKMVSCGATTTLGAALLRQAGHRVRLVHGTYRKNTHAWLQVWNRHVGQWADHDFMEASEQSRRPLAVCADWLELRDLLVAEARRYSPADSAELLVSRLDNRKKLRICRASGCSGNIERATA